MGVNAANRSPSRDAHAPRFMLLLLALLLPMFLLFIFILEEGGGVQCKDNCDSSIVVNGPPCIAIASNAAPPGEAVVVPLTNDDSRADASRTSAALTIRSTVLLMALAGVLLLLFADNAGLGISFFSTWLNTLPFDDDWAAMGIMEALLLVSLFVIDIAMSGVKAGGAISIAMCELTASGCELTASG